MVTPTSAPMSTALVPYTGGDTPTRMDAWVGLPDAERKRRAIEACIAHDKDTLYDLALAYLALDGRGSANVNPHTRRNYRRGIDALLSAWASKDLRKMTGNDARAWAKRLAVDAAHERNGAPRLPQHGPRGLAPATIRIYIAAARALYSALVWADAIATDPFGGVKAPRDTTNAWEKRDPYPDEDVERLLAVATPDERVLVLLGAHAGLRLAEALALDGRDVDLAGRRVTVRSGKGAKTRRALMSARLVAALRDLRGDGTASSYMQHGSVLPYTVQITARRHLMALCARAGVTYRGYHALRHTAGTRLMKETHDLLMVATQLGHASVETSRTYAKRDDDALKKALEAW